MEALPRSRVARFRDLELSREHLREVRYAALLHDFGKVGVREHVLLKANKLSDERLEIIRYRIELQHTFRCQQHPLVALVVEPQAHAMRQGRHQVFAQWTRRAQIASPSKAYQCAVRRIVDQQNPIPETIRKAANKPGCRADKCPMRW